jgi:hypothetical protein
MDEKLVTIATFGNTVEANLAKNRLETAGIRAFLADADTADMAWQLTSAIGGIKLQIPEGDEQVALALLEKPQEAMSRRASGSPRCKKRKVIVLTAITKDGLRIPAETAEELDEEEEDFPEEDEDEEEADVPEIDQVAERAWRGSLLGILFFPIEFYVLGLLLHIYFGREKPSPALHWKVVAATGINLLVLGTWFVFMSTFNLNPR